MLKDTKATRATRPLIEYPMHFEREYCHECGIIHMVEVVHTGKVICHGESYYFDTQTAKTHYSRRQGKGFELIQMTENQQQTALTLDWQIANEAKYIDIEQDW